MKALIIIIYSIIAFCPTLGAQHFLAPSSNKGQGFKRTEPGEISTDFLFDLDSEYLVDGELLTEVLTTEYENAYFLRVTIRAQDPNEEITGSMEFYIFKDEKTIVIDQIYPAFPKKKGGISQSRKLLLDLFLKPEFSGFHVISNATEEFQKSLKKLKEVNPLVQNRAEDRTKLRKIKTKMKKKFDDSPDFSIKSKKFYRLYMTLYGTWEIAKFHGQIPDVSNLPRGISEDRSRDRAA